MSYSLTTASSIDDVISQVCQYAVDHAGFAWESSTTVGGRTQFRISKNGLYWNFRAELYNPLMGPAWRIKSYMTTVLVNLIEPTELQGQYRATMTSLWNFPGPYPSLYLFSEGTCVHMVLEVTTGVFTHMSFGAIAKTDNFVGGEYLVGNFADYRSSYPNSLGQYPYLPELTNGYQSIAFLGDNGVGTATGGLPSQAYHYSYVRNVLDNPPTKAYGNFATVGLAVSFAVGPGTELQCAGMAGAGGMTDRIFRDAPNLGTLRSPIFPMYVTLRDPISSLRFLAGHIPNVRLCPMKYLDPGEIILTDWIVFPYIAKESNLVNYPSSGNYGLAYRRVP